MPADEPILPLTIIISGGICAWFGMHYWRDTKTLSPASMVKSVLQGNGLPPRNPEASIVGGLGALLTAVAGSGGDSGSTGIGTAAATVADALTYAGHCYLYGGPSDASACWDCSSFVTWVLGHDMGMPVPGGTWASTTGSGAAHGPASEAYLTYGSAVSGSPQSGDLLVYGTCHIGFAVNSTEMMSAQDEALKTNTSSIPATVDGCTLTIRRPAYSTGSTSTGTAPVVSGNYTSTELQQLWTSAGGSSAKASVAACIALAESSGNPKATSSNPDGGTNVGLWQLDTPGGGGAGYTVAQLQDPATNAKAAVAASSNGTNWSTWSTAPGCGA